MNGSPFTDNCQILQCACMNAPKVSVCLQRGGEQQDPVESNANPLFEGIEPTVAWFVSIALMNSNRLDSFQRPIHFIITVYMHLKHVQPKRQNIYLFGCILLKFYRCSVGFKSQRCDQKVNPCDYYCQNEGICTLTAFNEPKCK